MSNLTSTVPGAFNAFYNLLVTAGNTQSPAIPVFHSEVLEGQETQNGYVLLGGVDNHRMPLNEASTGYVFYEDYEVLGCVVYYAGGPDPTNLAENVLNQTWTIFQNVVMTTAVTNRGANGNQVLGASAPAALEWFLPGGADYSASQGNVGDATGWQGVIDFRFLARGRLTTA